MDENIPLHIPFGEIPLRLLGGSIPSLLARKFKRLQLETIGDLLQLSEAEFAKVPGVGGCNIAVYRRLQSDLRDNPEKYREMYSWGLVHDAVPTWRPSGGKGKKSNKYRFPPVYSGNETLLSLFPGLFETFLQLSTMPRRNRRIMRLTLGFDGEKHMQVELARKYGISREAVRQIRNRAVAAFRKTMTGRRTHTSKVWCYEHLADRFRRFERDLVSHSLLSMPNAISLATGTDNPMDLGESEKRHLAILFECFGYTLFADREDQFFFSAPFDSIGNMKAVYREVRAMMRGQVYPITADVVFSVVGLTVDNRQLRVEHIEELLQQSEIYEAVDWGGCRCYQLRFCSMLSLTERSVRVLRESGKPMRLNDLLAALRERLVGCGQDHEFTHQIVSGAIGRSPHTKPIGKLGIWKLKEWKVNSATMHALVREILLKASEPLSFGELMVRVNRRNPYARRKTIQATIGWHEEFTRLEDGRILLQDRGK